MGFWLRTCKLHKQLQQWFPVNNTKLRLYKSKLKVNSVHTVKLYGGVEVWVNSFLISALEGYSYADG